MNTNTRNFNPAELCSRKLWQVVVQAGAAPLDPCAERAVQELTQRQRYLAELARLGRLNQPH